MSVARKSNNSSTWADRNNWSAAEITGLAETRQGGSSGHHPTPLLLYSHLGSRSRLIRSIVRAPAEHETVRDHGT